MSIFVLLDEFGFVWTALTRTAPYWFRILTCVRRFLGYCTEELRHWACVKTNCLCWKIFYMLSVFPRQNRGNTNVHVLNSYVSSWRVSSLLWRCELLSWHLVSGFPEAARVCQQEKKKQEGKKNKVFVRVILDTMTGFKPVISWWISSTFPWPFDGPY